MPLTPPLPSHLVSHVDQARASMDSKVSTTIEKLREDLAEPGCDPASLWYSVTATWLHTSSPDELAAALASAMLRLAQQPRPQRGEQ